MTGKIIVQSEEFPGKGETLIYTTFENTFKNEKLLQILDKKTNQKLFTKFKLYDFKGKEDQIVVLELDDFYKTIIVVGAGETKNFSLASWKKLLANSFRKLQSMKVKSATVLYFDLLGKDLFAIGKNLSLALYLSNYYFDFYKSADERKKIKKLESLELLIKPKSTEAVDLRALEQGVKYGKLLAEGVYLTRDLVNQPASHIHPETLVEEAFKIEKESKGTIKVEVLDEEECRRLGMGAFLGVGQGSERKPKFIILKYKNPKTKIQKPKSICLIGKSITFDSGGLSLKPSESMEAMKMDMAGGATVLGIFKILAHSDAVRNMCEVYGILPACENMPSGKALKPGDIVTALNKKTVEVLNTDAEGRLTLADGLSYAEKYLKPDVIVDLATLTGACMVALGKEITGMFGNDDTVLATFEKVAKNEGEQLWRMPIYKPYAKKMKSDIADLKNIGGGRYGGAITAALFLAEFINKSKWVHFDIAGSAYNDEGSVNITPKGGTGWGVITLMEFLRELYN